MTCHTCQHGARDMYGDAEHVHCYFLVGEREHGETRCNYLERSRIEVKEECEYYKPRPGVG